MLSRFVAGQTSKLEEFALILPSWLHIIAQSRGVDISVSHDQGRVLQKSVLEELLFAKGVLLGRAFHTSIYSRSEEVMVRHCCLVVACITSNLLREFDCLVEVSMYETLQADGLKQRGQESLVLIPHTQRKDRHPRNHQLVVSGFLDVGEFDHWTVGQASQRILGLFEKLIVRKIGELLTYLLGQTSVISVRVSDH